MPAIITLRSVARGVVKISQEGETALNGNRIGNVHSERQKTFLKRPLSGPSSQAFPFCRRSYLCPFVICANVLIPSLAAVLPAQGRAESAVRHSDAIENGQVHEIIAKDMGDDRGERLSAANMRKDPVAVQAGRHEPEHAADSRKNLSH